MMSPSEMNSVASLPGVIEPICLSTPKISAVANVIRLMASSGDKP